MSRKIERREEVNRSGSSPAFDLPSVPAPHAAHSSYESAAFLSNATATRCQLSETTAEICLLGCEGERYPVNCRQLGRGARTLTSWQRTGTVRCGARSAPCCLSWVMIVVAIQGRRIAAMDGRESRGRLDCSLSAENRVNATWSQTQRHGSTRHLVEFGSVDVT